MTDYRVKRCKNCGFALITCLANPCQVFEAFDANSNNGEERYESYLSDLICDIHGELKEESGCCDDQL